MDFIKLLSFMTLIAMGVSCDSDKKAETAVLNLAPNPTKAERFIGGFSPDALTISLDFSTGKMEYREELAEADQTPSCYGQATIELSASDFDRIVSGVSVCTGKEENPATDGTYNNLSFYYAEGTQIDARLKPEVLESGLVKVTINESFNSFLGDQLFSCNGQFALDQVFKKNVSCLSLLD